MNIRLSSILVFLLFSFNAVAEEPYKEAQLSYSGIKLGSIYANETFFINDPNAPVQISDLSVVHVTSDTAEMLSSLRRQGLKLSDVETDPKSDLFKGVDFDREKLTVRISASGEEAMAIKFTIVAIDGFKEVLGGLTGVTMDPPEANMTWNYTPSYLFKFKKYGVLGVYVQQVRMADGKIWNYDERKVQKKFLEKFDDLDKGKLKEAFDQTN